MQTSKSTLVTVGNALRLLKLFSHETAEIGVNEMSRALMLAKSTVSRMVSTLVQESILERNPENGKYRLNPLLLEIGLIAQERFGRESATNPPEEGRHERGSP
ncbi:MULTISPECIES: helix-turn-helix domain-containing protein [Kyrpidia]|uniref:helix-turn-helix domain-containing protein n=1 Tax=Kyrpidia TaxID=1129704 RepID=UPI0012FFD439|nr:MULTISPECIES: helix-turn-helix domain-containing protein [Kyrpidia]MCL6575445.1 helix-turn-helix domain-containing protein [Kyrpidia sp.]